MIEAGRTSVVRCGWAMAFALVLLPNAAWGQRGGMGGRETGGMGEMGAQMPRFSAPVLPGPELDGPPDATEVRKLLTLTDEQVKRYEQARDSFVTATKPQRDSIHTQLEIMNDKLSSGDRAAALFYAQRATKISRGLKDLQGKWEEAVLFKILSADQTRIYKKWKKEAEEADVEQQKRDAMRWNPMMGGTTGREEKTEIAAPVGSPAGSSPAVRVGRMIYTAGQVALDAEGSIVGEGDLHAQTVKAFANLAAVLQAARARPSDVVRLTIYVVNYKPQDLAMIREAGAAFLPRSDAPALTVLGVQSLYREGLLISIEATALAGAPGVGAGRDRAEPR